MKLASTEKRGIDGEAGTEFKEDSPTVGAIIGELAHGIRHVIQGEVRLATAEIKDTASRASKRGIAVAAWGAIAALGVFPFLAFVCIGLGRVLNDKFWLSSLIVAVVMMGIGGFMAYAASKRFKFQDLSLPHTRHTLRSESELLSREVKEARREVIDIFERRRV